MSDAQTTHEEAMRLAERAEIARIEGNTPLAEELTKRAFEMEREAAQVLFERVEVEPTRSVLFRSAAVLALESGYPEEAERLAAQGLGGHPPDEIAAELREIMEETAFRARLFIRGLRLLPEEFHMSMVGPAISAGIAPTDIVLAKLRSLEDLLFRTAERSAGRTYRTRGRRPREVVRDYEMFLSAPQAGSFALSIRLGQSQSSFAGIGSAEGMIDELFTCLELFGSKREKELHERIRDDAYFANFVSLARRVAPDGEAVRWVRFTAHRAGQTRHVELGSGTKLSASIELPFTQPTESEREVRIRGVLRWADALKDVEKVRIVDAEGRTYNVQVPPGVDDIVKPYWLEEVIVTGRRGPRGAIILEDVKPVRENE
jgi:hypothetical protein